MKRRFYTTGEIARIRAMWDTHTITEIAELLNRSPEALRVKAAHLGLWKFHPYASFGVEADVFFTEHHRDGYSDAEIAQLWGCNHQTVGRWRRGRRLPANRYNRRHVAKVQKVRRQQFRECGVHNLAELKSLTHRQQAVQRGWPEDCLPRECDVLDAIRDGHDTLPAICAKLGLPYKCGRALHSRNETRTGRLMRKGYIKCAGKRNYKPGRGFNLAVYALCITKTIRNHEAA